MALYKDNVRNGIIGHAIGDALGVPVEFTDRDTLKRNPVTGMLSGGTYGMPAGTWSDDTSMELCLLAALVDTGHFDYVEIMNNFVKWRYDDRFTATNTCFDIGGTCASAIASFRNGTAPLECGRSDERSNGNGSLMRILPAVFVCHKLGLDDQRRYECIRDVSSLTHAHPVSILGCYIYANYICELLDGHDKKEAYERMKQHDYSMFAPATLYEYVRILKDDISKYPESDILSTGYVRATLEAALWCVLSTDNYSDAVLTAVNLGNDTDTVGAITGSMAGIIYGDEAIPEEWKKTLKRANLLVTMAEGFAETEIHL